ncbi:hypothetical protein [Terriglobus sp.]|uniref:hypothetical protein n=1 Tax=Terriglobus sp. TaxID=1889013 RepID=UPI003AFF7FB7
MFTLVGAAAAIFIVIAVIGIFYFAGNRGRQANVANQENAAKGHQQSVPHEPARSQGRGDL